MPGATGTPLTHTALPPEHVKMPVRQTLVGEQAAPVTHDPQPPSPLQKALVPQRVPAEAGTAAQTAAPLPHRVCPTKHESPASQAAPSVQLAQPPSPSHTAFIPQLVPAATAPAARHRSKPWEQSVTPPAQADSAHDAPEVHPTQPPSAAQTAEVPHEVPTGNVPVEEHCADPVLQSRDPRRHGPLMQLLPASQATQPPSPSQTPAAQLAPAGTGPAAAHAAEGHVTVPRWHASAGVHMPPGVQPVTHWPA